MTAPSETDIARHIRLVEALVFAAAEPVGDAALRERLPDDADLGAIIAELAEHYRGRGVNLVRVAGGWAFRTAEDLAGELRKGREAARRLSRAALETLAIVAYHQPVTRAEIEGIRGVSISKGTLDLLMEAGWVRPGRRRQTPGRPLTWVTTTGFLDHFGLGSLDELPGVQELKAAGLLDSRPAVARLPGHRAEDGDGDADGDGDGGAESDTDVPPSATPDHGAGR